MTPSQRIILNTLATYGRSLFGVAVGLFSARWVLQALGQRDFGLYGVVGSIVVFITFLNGIMAGSVARFYAYAIGSQKQKAIINTNGNMREWFNAALSIHLLLPIALILVGYPIGVYAIRHWLTIPPERIMACVWVLRISLVTAFINMCSVPFTAMYVAYQYISELALFNILGLCGTFIGAYFLLSASGDRLLIYALYLIAINAGIPVLQVIRACIKFPECRFDYNAFLNQTRRNCLIRFAGWQLFGGTGAILRVQGTAVLLNLFFGPITNASYSIASQLSAQTSTLSAALINALQPAITSEEGSGNRDRVKILAIRASKFSTLLILMFAVPLALEMNNVLRLWLKAPPAYTSGLCVLMLISLLLDKTTVGHAIAIAAQGNIAFYQGLLGSSMIAALPITWACFYFFRKPMSLGVPLVSSVIFCLLGRLYFGKKLLEIEPKTWTQQLLLPLIKVMLVSLFAGLLVCYFMPPSFFRLCQTTIVTVSIIALAGWFFVLDASERRFIISQLRYLCGK